MTSTRILSITAAAVALATPAAVTVAADAASKVAFDGKPSLVETSNGAYVDYELTRTTSLKGHTVQIDGAKAKVIRLDGAEYRGTVMRPSLERGRSYTVKITIARPGADLVRTQKLVLRKGGA